MDLFNDIVNMIIYAMGINIVMGFFGIKFPNSTLNLIIVLGIAIWLADKYPIIKRRRWKPKVDSPEKIQKRYDKGFIPDDKGTHEQSDERCYE